MNQYRRRICADDIPYQLPAAMQKKNLTYDVLCYFRKKSEMNTISQLVFSDEDIKKGII